MMRQIYIFLSLVLTVCVSVACPGQPSEEEVAANDLREQKCLDAVEGGWTGWTGEDSFLLCLRFLKVKSDDSGYMAVGGQVYPCIHGGLAAMCWINRDESLSIYWNFQDAVFLPKDSRYMVEPYLVWFGGGEIYNSPDLVEPLRR